MTGGTSPTQGDDVPHLTFPAMLFGEPVTVTWFLLVQSRTLINATNRQILYIRPNLLRRYNGLAEVDKRGIPFIFFTV